MRASRCRLLHGRQGTFVPSSLQFNACDCKPKNFPISFSKHGEHLDTLRQTFSVHMVSRKLFPSNTRAAGIGHISLAFPLPPGAFKGEIFLPSTISPAKASALLKAQESATSVSVTGAVRCVLFTDASLVDRYAWQGLPDSAGIGVVVKPFTPEMEDVHEAWHVETTSRDTRFLESLAVAQGLWSLFNLLREAIFQGRLVASADPTSSTLGCNGKPIHVELFTDDRRTLHTLRLTQNWMATLPRCYVTPPTSLLYQREMLRHQSISQAIEASEMLQTLGFPVRLQLHWMPGQLGGETVVPQHQDAHNLAGEARRRQSDIRRVGGNKEDTTQTSIIRRIRSPLLHPGWAKHLRTQALLIQDAEDAYRIGLINSSTRDRILQKSGMERRSSMETMQKQVLSVLETKVGSALPEKLCLPEQQSMIPGIMPSRIRGKHAFEELTLKPILGGGNPIQQTEETSPQVAKGNDVERLGAWNLNDKTKSPNGEGFVRTGGLSLSRAEKDLEMRERALEIRERELALAIKEREIALAIKERESALAIKERESALAIKERESALAIKERKIAVGIRERESAVPSPEGEGAVNSENT
ncbi:hypothetical protein QBC39DRAFT_23712 [Podospora conica]|nr:hypothetical protein QBC39DRAFT_23712 [Schizothecium conicum]